MGMSRKSIGDWFAETFHLKDIPFMGVPTYMFSIEYWLGGIASAALFWQALTGLLMLLYYQPSDAYDSTMAIIHSVPFGSVLLSSHLYGAYIMILAVYIHGLHVYFKGAYKKPRQFQWVLGVLMFAMVMITSFVGYSMTGDVLGTDAVDVGKGILASIHLSVLTPIFFGNGTELDLFTRLLGWHIILVTLVVLLFALHFYLAEQNGFMPDLKEAKYKAPAVLRKDDARIKPWWPRNFIFMIGIVTLTWGIILMLPSILALPQIVDKVPILFSPYPGPSPASPQASLVPAYPPWFFLFMYKMADMPFPLAVDVSMGALIPLVVLIVVPFIDRNEELHPLDRPFLTALFITGLTWLIELSIWGAGQPGVPVRPIWLLLVIIPPFIISFGGIYLLHLMWRSIKPKVINADPGDKTTASNVAEDKVDKLLSALSIIVTAVAVIILLLSFSLNPITDGPLIGLSWSALLLLFSADVFIYFRYELK